MPQPPQYLRITDFSTDEANNLSGRSTVRTANLDTELDNVKASLDQLISNIGLIQRDDGYLLDGIVTQASLSSAVTALFVAIGANPRGAWLTATAYAVKDIIETGSPVAPYMCVTAHTSGVFADDYTAGKWVVIGAALPAASQVSVTPTGDIAATNAQSAFAEIAAEKMAKASNGSDFANIATTRTNLSVFSQPESQTSSFITATAAGTFDAITASFTPAITALNNNQIVYIRAAGTNASTTPTFTPNSGVVAAKTIMKFAGTALVSGDIIGNHHVIQLQYNSALDAWLLLNPSTSLDLTNGLGPLFINNYSLAGTVALNALTITLSGYDGTALSSTNKAQFTFRGAVPGDGKTYMTSVPANKTLVISSGSRLGSFNNVPFRIWIVLFNDAGTMRLGAINCSTVTTIVGEIYPLADDMLTSSTAEGGVGAADSDGVFYTDTAVAAKALRVLGYMDFTLAVAGTWDVLPTKIQLWQPGMKLPGDVVQTRNQSHGNAATGTTLLPADDTIPQQTEGDQYMTVAITPISAQNMLKIDARALAASSVLNNIVMALFRDVTAAAFVSDSILAPADTQSPLIIEKTIQALSTAATTINVRIGGNAAGTTTFNGRSGVRMYGGSLGSFVRVQEIMG